MGLYGFFRSELKKVFFLFCFFLGGEGGKGVGETVEGGLGDVREGGKDWTGAMGGRESGGEGGGGVE